MRALFEGRAVAVVAADRAADISLRWTPSARMNCRSTSSARRGDAVAARCRRPAPA